MSDAAQGGRLKRAREEGARPDTAEAIKPAAPIGLDAAESLLGIGTGFARGRPGFHPVRPADPPSSQASSTTPTASKLVPRENDASEGSLKHFPKQKSAVGKDSGGTGAGTVSRNETATVNGAPLPSDADAVKPVTSKFGKNNVRFICGGSVNGVENSKGSQSGIDDGQKIPQTQGSKIALTATSPASGHLKTNGKGKTKALLARANVGTSAGNGADINAATSTGRLSPRSDGKTPLTVEPLRHLKTCASKSDLSTNSSTDGESSSRVGGSEDTSKAKRRRRAIRTPTPPVSTIGGEEADQELVAPLSGDPGAVRRLRRRADGSEGAPLNGKHSLSSNEPTSSANSNNALVPPNIAGQAPVKKRNRLALKDTSASGQAIGPPGGSEKTAGGARLAGRTARGRGSGRGKGRGRGRRRGSIMDHSNPRGPSNKARDTSRWRTHCMVEDFVNTCGNIMYPQVTLGPFGYASNQGQFPLERPTTLGMMTTQLRRPTVIEKWSPYQVALFEGAISIHGKVFHKVADEIDGKTVPDVIEFYYMWKKTNHYKQWKAMWRNEQAILHPPGDAGSSDEDRQASALSSERKIRAEARGRKSGQQRA